MTTKQAVWKLKRTILITNIITGSIVKGTAGKQYHVNTTIKEPSHKNATAFILGTSVSSLMLFDSSKISSLSTPFSGWAHEAL